MRRWVFAGAMGGLAVGLHAMRALAHVGMRIEDERLNIGLVVLSFVLIGAFIYVAAQGRGGRGGRGSTFRGP